jgi:peptidoglycan/LPS O-acetylase OafA/YrhL
VSATEPGRRTARFPLFDGLRALAALAIVVYHIGPYTAAGSAEGALAPYFARLNVGVAVFFAISGFLLYRPMLAARARDQHFSVPTYGRRRFLRIVPGYWVALTVLMIFPGLPDMPSGRNWVYYFFAQNYDSYTVHGGIGPAWSLGCEVIYYAVLPLLTMAFTSVARRAGKRICWRLELLAIGMMVAGSVVYRITMVPDPASGPPATFQSNFGWFALGMVLAMASVASEDQPTRWLGRVKRHAWMGWPVAAIAYLALCRCAGTSPSLAVTSSQNTAQQLLIYALSGAVAVGLTLPAACQTTPRGVIGRLLGSPVLTRAGIISYGLYLYHLPIMIKLNAVMMTSSHDTYRLVLLTTATLALATVAATLSYYLIERPALGLAHRITARTRTGMTAALGDTSA